MDKQRASFEAWASTQQGYGTADNPVNDSLGATRNAWKVWQAALASSEVQAMRLDLEQYVSIASELATENEALRRDAERYRWLREQHEKPVGWLTICEAGTWDLKPWSGDDPDTTIDAAMEKQK